MTDLTCKTKNCEHNLKNICHAAIIQVGENGSCRSKIKRSGGILEQTFAEIEAANDLDDTPRDNYVACEANCIYQENHLCKAGRIMLSDTMVTMRTKCDTRKR